MKGVGIGHGTPTLVEQHLLWAAFAPRARAGASWSTLVRTDGLDAVPPTLHDLLPLVAAHLEAVEELPFAGHLAGFRRRSWMLSAGAARHTAAVIEQLSPADVVVLGDLALADGQPPGARRVRSVLLWLPRAHPDEVVGRLTAAAPATDDLIVLGGGPVPVVVAVGAAPWLGPPTRPAAGVRWDGERTIMSLDATDAVTLGADALLAHTWIGTAWRADVALAAADVHRLVTSEKCDLATVVELVDDVGAIAAIRTSLPYLSTAFGSEAYAEVAGLVRHRRRTVGEQVVRWIDRPVAGVGPAPRSALGYLALVPPGRLPGPGAVAHLRRRRVLNGSGGSRHEAIASARRIMRRSTPRTDRLLLEMAQFAAGVRSSVDEPVDAVDPDDLLRRVDWHRLAGVAHRALAGHRLPGTLDRRLQLGSHGARRSHLAALAELRHLSTVLDLPFLVVKGPVLAQRYGDVGMRSYGDIDVLVGDQDFVAAQRALSDAGYRPGTDPDANSRRFAQVPYRRAGGVDVDLHRHLLAAEHRRRGSRVSSAELVERSVPIDLAAGRVATLDPVDTAVHVAVHGATSGADRLIWLIDFAVTMDGLDVDEVVDRSAQWGASADVAFMARRTAESGLHPQAGALARRVDVSRPFAALARCSVSAFPIERASGRFTVARHVAAHARPTASATLGAMGRDQWSRGRSLVGQMGTMGEDA